MSDNKTPDDYSTQDGLTDGLIDQCPHCKQSLHPDSHSDQVYRSDGTAYDHILDTNPGDRPFYCPGCYKTLDANRKANEHQQLSEFNE